MITIALILAIDAFSKYWVQSNLPVMDQYSLWYPYGGIGVFKNFLGTEFSIVHATNHGAAWSLFSDYQGYLMVLRFLLAAGLVIYLFFYNTRQSWIAPLSLIVAGAIGNIIDYFVYGHVIDMFQFTFWGRPYPIFNIADSAISVGILWLVLLSLPEEKTT